MSNIRQQRRQAILAAAPVNEQLEALHDQVAVLTAAVAAKDAGFAPAAKYAAQAQRIAKIKGGIPRPAGPNPEGRRP